MFLKLLGSPYWSTPTAFATSLSIEAAAARLRVATTSSIFNTTKESAVGDVSSQKVSLHRFVPGKGNSFKPIFVGRFEARDGVTELHGVFALHWLVKLFMSFWYGACIYWTVLTIQSGQSWLVTLLGVGMLFTGAAFVWFFRWLADDDRRYLSDVITKALAKNAA